MSETGTKRALTPQESWAGLPTRLRRTADSWAQLLERAEQTLRSQGRLLDEGACADLLRCRDGALWLIPLVEAMAVGPAASQVYPFTSHTDLRFAGDLNAGGIPVKVLEPRIVPVSEGWFRVLLPEKPARPWDGEWYTIGQGGPFEVAATAADLIDAELRRS